MDNKQFVVNGDSKKLLEKTLEVALLQGNYGDIQAVKGFKFSKTHGLILLWYVSGDDNALPTPSKSSKIVTDIVWEWLMSNEAKQCLEHLDGWDTDFDHDGHNSIGWKVYCEDWGHVDHKHNAIVAVKPVYLWHGK